MFRNTLIINNIENPPKTKFGFVIVDIAAPVKPSRPLPFIFSFIPELIPPSSFF